MKIKKLFSIPWLLVGDKLIKAYCQFSSESIIDSAKVFGNENEII